MTILDLILSDNIRPLLQLHVKVQEQKVFDAR